MPESCSGRSASCPSGGQLAEAAGSRAPRRSWRGSHGSSGSGQTINVCSRACGQSAATRFPAASSQTGKRMPLIPSCSGSSNVGGSAPSSSQLASRRRQLASPAGSAWPPGQQMVPRVTDGGRGSATSDAPRASSRLFTWLSSGMALAKPN